MMREIHFFAHHVDFANMLSLSIHLLQDHVVLLSQSMTRPIDNR